MAEMQVAAEPGRPHGVQAPRTAMAPREDAEIERQHDHVADVELGTYGDKAPVAEVGPAMGVIVHPVSSMQSPATSPG